MMARLTLTVLAALFLCTTVTAEEHDYYKYLRYPSKPLPGVGVDKVEQEGGAEAVGYKRRTVKWWPRKGQDIVDIPEGVPLREWTRNKGQEDKEALAGICRSWTASDSEKFKAHLIGFMSFGTSSVHKSADWDYRTKPDWGQTIIPIAILRMENGERRGVYSPLYHSSMISEEDHDFIHKKWEEEFPKLYAKTSRKPAKPRANEGIPLKVWDEARPKLYAIDAGDDAKFPLFGENEETMLLNTPNFHFITKPNAWGKPQNWMNPDSVEDRNLYRTNVMEFAENMWAYLEAAGGCMPFWRIPGENYKFIVQVRVGGSAGGWMHCGIRDGCIQALSHEFGMPCVGGGYFIFTQGDATQHMALPSEIMTFNGNFCYPWRNANRVQYKSSMWMFVLGDNPNWGYGSPAVYGGFGSVGEWTPYHTIARTGQEKGLWENGVRGFGDFFGEYAARMVTVDICEQYLLRSRYGMPEVSYLYPAYGNDNRYRISNAEAPRWCGYNIIRLIPEEGAKEITVDLHGFHDPELHSDWRGCIVAVDGKGRARYSPMWNKGKMTLPLKPSDKNLWLTVSASPSAFPLGGEGAGERAWHLLGIHAPRYPWEATFTGCRPGTPHRRQGDVETYDELYSINNGNKYLDYPTKTEVPIPLDEKDGELVQEKLDDMLGRIDASTAAVEEKVAAGLVGKELWWKDWWTLRRLEVLGDLKGRAEFLKRSAKGHRHPNGGGFVSDSANVAETAYVGPDAMVLDGAIVKDNACIKEFAVVIGPKAVVSGNAKLSGRAWVAGNVQIGGNARILEGATVTSTWRQRQNIKHGQGAIDGNAVIKGDSFLYLAFAEDQQITGGLVMDYGATVNNGASGVFDRGRFYRENHRFDKAGGFGGGVDAGQLYVNWQFNQPKAVLMEDAYVNNNGILYGRPNFADDGERHYIEFNGKDQYAEAPPSVADFGELTIDMLVNRSGNQSGRLFDFGTGDDECFHLSVDGSGKLTLAAKHDGKSHNLASTQSVPADRWARVRVEMDGKNAAIHVDGKQIAGGPFDFQPRSVFIGDRAEGNFIACGRNKDNFFKGRMDHFRVYRKVHEDFAAVGLPPLPLTRLQEWSEADQERHDQWQARRQAKDAEIAAGEYGELQKQIQKLHQERGALHNVPNLAEADARVKKADGTRNKLEGEIHQRYQDWPQRVEIEKEIAELGKKVDDIARRVRESAEYVKLGEEIQAHEKRRGEVSARAAKNPKLDDIIAKIEAANQEKAKIEEQIPKLPEVTQLAAAVEKEQDGQKKQQLREKYNRLLALKKSSNPQWQKTEIVLRDLRNSQNELQRKAAESNAAKIKLEGQIRKLHQKRGELNAKLLEADAQYAKLQKDRAEKQAALAAKRRQIEESIRSSADYKNAVAESAAARKAIEDHRKRTIEGRQGEIKKLDGRIQQLYKQANSIRETALREAGLTGGNPYPGRSQARMQQAQLDMTYHETADWENRTPEEFNGTAPPKLKKWLKEVRGY